MKGFQRFLILSLLVTTYSCKKDSNEPQPTMVLDQEEVEKSIIGTWEGETSSDRFSGILRIEIDETLGGLGAWKDARGCECGVKWTYSSFSDGFVRLAEESTYATGCTCFERGRVSIYFMSDDLNTLHATQGFSQGGAIYRGELKRVSD